MSTTEPQDSVADRLSAVRRSTGLTQDQMASRLSIPVGTLRGYEQGKREVSAAVLVAFMQGWGIHPVWLLTGTGPKHLQPNARAIDDDQADGIASKVFRQFSDRLDFPSEDLPVLLEALAAAARRGADRAVANGPAA